MDLTKLSEQWGDMVTTQSGAGKTEVYSNKNNTINLVYWIELDAWRFMSYQGCMIGSALLTDANEDILEENYQLVKTLYEYQESKLKKAIGS